MAKKSIVRRESRRARLIEKYRELRAQLQCTIHSDQSDDAEREAAEKHFARLPRDASTSRKTNRCECCGRPRGVYRKFRLCRSCLRGAMVQGDVPGLMKASW